MPRSRRWFQFSLRGFLIALSLACLWLGWNVDRARRRGEAIEAAVDTGGCYVGYLGPSDLWIGPGECPDHFWADVKCIPVQIRFFDDAWSGGSLKPHIASRLLTIEGIGELWIPFRIGRRFSSLDEKHQMDELRQLFPESAVCKTEMR